MTRSGPPTATRRRPAEVRALLLEAAAGVFAAKGFQAAGTAEIAAAAGVSESALFRHFGTKTDLFAAAAVEPFTQFMHDFAQVWQRQRAEGLEDGTLMREFVTELYDSVQSSREIVLALLIAEDDPDHPALLAARQAFTRLFAELQAIGEDWTASRGVTIPGIELHERILIGMVTSMVLFDRWFLADADGRPLPREVALEALIDFAHYGASQRARRAAGAPDDPSASAT
jgi:AcrR family transcriptional regulator